MFIKSIVGLAVVAVAAAQSGGTTSNSTIDPQSVTASLRCESAIYEAILDMKTD
jgi:hypothetical protein